MKKCFSICLTILLLSTVIIGMVAHNDKAYADPAAYYVSPTGNDITGDGTINNPYQSITKARDVIRTELADGMDHDIVVYIRGGNYYHSAAITFTENDSGRDGYEVVYRNYQGETPVFYGGEPITGWTQYSGNIYYKDVGSGWRCHCLSENGIRSVVARHPNDSYNTVSATYTSDPDYYFYYGEGDLPEFSDTNDLECCIWPGGPDGIWNWYQDINPVYSINTSARLVRLVNQSRYMEPGDGYDMGAGSRYFMQGAIELLDQAGEFYLDSSIGRLYYWPRNGSIESQTIVAAKTIHIFEFYGSTSTATVENITLDGLEMSTSEYNVDEQYEGMIALENANNITIQNCRIHNSGSSAIMCTSNGTSNNTFSGNLMYDLGFHGVSMYYDGGHNTITNNHIYNLGQIVGNGAGVSMSASGNNTISYNRIHHGGRSGIEGYSTGVANNLIEYNDVFEIMRDSQDGGAYYTYFANGPNTVRYNKFHDYEVFFSVAVGYYLDDRTDYTSGYNNLIYRLQRYDAGGELFTSVQIKGTDNLFSNNVVANCRPSEYSVVSPYRNYDGTDSIGQEYLRNIYYEAAPVTQYQNDGTIYFIDEMNPGKFEDSDYNLAYNSSGNYMVRIGEWSTTFINWAQWQTTYGFDENSVTGQDPLFMDEANDDYRLQYNSPAFDLGIESINEEPMGLLSTFPFTDSSESIDKLFIKTTASDAGQSYVDLDLSETAQLAVSGRTVSGYLLADLSTYTSYQSSNASVAEVNGSGVVTAMSDGVARITASVTKNSVVSTVAIDIIVGSGGPTPTATPTETSTSTATATPTSTPPPAGNMVQNPGFEDGNANWDLWDNSGYVANNEHSGDNAMRVGTNSGGCSQDISSGVIPGESYTISGWGKCSAGMSEAAQVGVECLDSSSQTLLQVYNDPYFSAEYSQGSTTFTAPAGTVTIRVYLYKDASTAYSYFDDISLMHNGGTTPTPTPEETPTSTATPTETSTSTATATPTSTPPPAGNMVQNPGFEDGNANWDLWDNSGYVINNAHSGDNAMRVGTNSGGCSQDISTGVTPGESYTISGWGKCSAGISEAAQVGVECLDSQGQTLLQVYNDPYFSAEYSQGSTTFTAPAGTVTIRVYLYKDASTAYAYFDDISLIQN